MVLVSLRNFFAAVFLAFQDFSTSINFSLRNDFGFVAQWLWFRCAMILLSLRVPSPSPAPSVPVGGGASGRCCVCQGASQVSRGSGMKQVRKLEEIFRKATGLMTAAVFGLLVTGRGQLALLPRGDGLRSW